MPKATNVKRFIDRACLAAILALAAGSALQAAEPAQPPAAAAPEAPAGTPSAAPELAPGIAPGVVPGARPATGGGAPAAPADAAAPSPGEGAATQVSPQEVIGSPDWPCQQRKVLTITSAQIWDGPSIENLKVENDTGINDLTAVLASRRVSLEDAEKAIKEFAAAQPEAVRDRKLTELFASVLDKTNTDRQFVLSRIEEFQRHQKGRAAELEREGQKLSEKKPTAADQLVPVETRLPPEQQEYNWNARIFQDRQQNLTLACEIPGLIEQRAYEIARLIRAQMKS
jgi:hypothetical protein